MPRASVLSWNTWTALAFAPVLVAITIPLVKGGLRTCPQAD